MTPNTGFGWILGAAIVAGLGLFGYQLSNAAVTFKEYERSVTVKGLAEREYQADIVIWPLQFTVADNQLESLYQTLESNTHKIREFLVDAGIEKSAISYSTPIITDKSAQQYGGDMPVKYRYTASQTVTVYTDKINNVRAVMNNISQLGKQGIVFSGDYYQAQTEYLFTRLNEVKPEMIEEATKKAREVAEKFAKDSDSQLGKIKRASQGQFTIGHRDKNNPHIKKIRVVSTVTYYLSD
ncbi:SIMPL domain-containing protein [Aestuariibacter sp. AA17]|uniref:SIMPL domain-containing protein n=1 Tax=Fluctibacter corallii TaxID=2984329 RepID=A0ABT3A905_9ALTE|nr:SIMPL domain-containing protein [Aestuariibacter sp. AA17]MCV2885165.1 SIMPL domain-containing protein [Aestuariibacter sp. AA17]